MFSPQLVDEALRRDRLVDPQEQQSRHTLVAPAERDGRPVVEHLERSEDPELEHVTVVTGFRTL